MRKARNLSLSVAALIGVASCSSVVPTLAPRLHDNAVAYDTAISDINDRVLLANIVRARDYVPLDITELSTVTGTLSEQATLGLSVPFGGNYGSTPRGIATPSVQVGAAPTFSMAALNTRAFTLNIIQPISPVYVASKWNTGISHELLMLLFVKDIQFADSYAPSLAQCSAPPGGAPSDGKSLVVCHHKVINNPDSPGEEQAFRAVVESMLPSVGLKVMTILEPVGPPFPFQPHVETMETTTGASAKSSARETQRLTEASQSATPLDAYNLATRLSDGQFHVGNDERRPGYGQLYHVFTNQVAVCADDPVRTPLGTFYIYPVGADVATAKQTEANRTQAQSVPFAKEWEDRLLAFKHECENGAHADSSACEAVTALKGSPRSAPGASAFASYSVVMSAVNSGGVGRDNPEPVPAGRAGSIPATNNAGPAVTSSLVQNRVGALLRAADCYADQTVREPTTESDFRKYTETLGHIEWRSVAEVFQYLGAVLRQTEGITWSDHSQRDVIGSQEASIPDAMFVLRQAAKGDGGHARVRIDYGGDELAVASGQVNSDGRLLNDRSLLVLSLLSELVNSAKISSDIPVTQQLQVLP
jgi:hypothetical protein